VLWRSVEARFAAGPLPPSGASRHKALFLLVCRITERNIQAEHAVSMLLLLCYKCCFASAAAASPPSTTTCARGSSCRRTTTWRCTCR
jgi:hypothetical protein